MPSLTRDSQRIVIAGASSLVGAELRSLLEESRFAGADLRLLDEEVAAGTLTEAAGEAAVIQTVEEGSFDRASTVFFSGSPNFTKANLTAARASGARVIDLTGAALTEGDAVLWFPQLDALLGRKFPGEGGAKLFAIPTAAATAAGSLALALAGVGATRLVFMSLQPVSDAGRAGIEELESQTGQLLSFQGVGQPVFDAQVAFNLLDRFGPESAQKLNASRQRLIVETQACVVGKVAVPALQVIHAPVFYGTAFTACADMPAGTNAEQVATACREAGFVIAMDASGPSNVSVAGERYVHLARPEEDPGRGGAWWFWGAADDIRLPAANAVKLAEMLN
jgi:aspartate-semialdehyde dehydrogenase